jgi:hypothetical protein
VTILATGTKAVLDAGYLGALSMKPRFATLALAAMAVIAPAAAASADTTPLPIQSISSSGSGCPQGSVGQSISGDRTTFTMIFDQFVASTGPGVAASEGAKDCRLDIVLSLPHRWHVTGVSLQRRGYVQLADGSTATAKLGTKVRGRKFRPTTPVTFDGPVGKDYVASTSLKATRGLGRCNGATQTLSVLTSVQVDPAPSTVQGQITTDSLDGKVTIGRCGKH